MEHNLKIQTNIQIPKRFQILHEIWSEEPKRSQFFSEYLIFFKLNFLKKPKNIIENTNPELKKSICNPKNIFEIPRRPNIHKNQLLWVPYRNSNRIWIRTETRISKKTNMYFSLDPYPNHTNYNDIFQNFKDLIYIFWVDFGLVSRV